MRTLIFEIRWHVRMILAVLVIVAAAMLFARWGSEQTIPLSSMVTTSPQASMRYFDDIVAGDEMEAIRTNILTTHRSTQRAFLVNATNEKDAISASAGVLFGLQSPDTAVPINTPTSKRGGHWLVVYLGLGPSYPTAFVIEKISTNADKIKVTFRRAKAAESTADIHHYYYWLPVGKLTPGTYQIELYDSDLNDVTLSRRVEVRE